MDLSERRIDVRVSDGALGVADQHHGHERCVCWLWDVERSESVYPRGIDAKAEGEREVIAGAGVRGAFRR
jgi:hypothetical protein